MRTRIKTKTTKKLNVWKEVQTARKEIQRLTEQLKTDSISWMCAKKVATSMYWNNYSNQLTQAT